MNGLTPSALSQQTLPPGLEPGAVPQITGPFARCDKSTIQQGSVLTRSVMVNITGSLANLAMQGTQAGVWRPVEGMQLRVFGMSSDADAQIATNQLRTALIHEVKLIEHRSTFPVPMGVNIECVPSNEKTDMGDGYAYTVLPHSIISVPQVLYQCDVGAEEGNQWRKDFPKYNAGNIEKEGILEVQNCPYVFVHQDHPVIMLLRHNSNLIGCNIDDQPKIDNEWCAPASPRPRARRRLTPPRAPQVQGLAPGALRVLPGAAVQGPQPRRRQRPQPLPGPGLPAQRAELGRHQRRVPPAPELRGRPHLDRRARRRREARPRRALPEHPLHLHGPPADQVRDPDPAVSSDSAWGAAGACIKTRGRAARRMPSPFHKAFSLGSLLLCLLLAARARASPALLEPLTTAAVLPEQRPHAPALPEQRPHAPALPEQRPHAADTGDETGLLSVIQSIRSSLLRVEAFLFAPPCNATSPFAVSCNDTAPAAVSPHRSDWLGRHHFGLRRTLLSAPGAPERRAPSPTPPFGWEDATPGPDGFYDSAPDDELPRLVPYGN
jgi:hypothetical protein